MNRFFVFLTFVFMLIFANVSMATEAPSIDIQYNEVSLGKITSPESFATILYALVTADNAQSETKDSQIHALFLDKSLLMLYEKVAAMDAKSNEVGCLNDFKHFTGAQEDSQGFWIGKVTSQNKTFIVPVYLNFHSALDVNKPRIMLKVIKTDQGFKVIDIIYPDLKNASFSSMVQTCLTQK